MAKIDPLRPILSTAAILLVACSAAAAQTTHPPGAVVAPTQAATTPAVQAKPEDVGDALMTHQRYQAAIEAYNKAPRTAEVWNKTGIAYQMMFDQKDAERCYKASLKLNRKDARVMNNLATLYDSLKQYRKAEKMYRKALKIDPHSALVQKNLGTNLLTQHKYKKGWQAYQAAIAIDPSIFQNQSGPQARNVASVQDRGAVNYYLARSFVTAGQLDRAIQYLRMAMNEGFTDAKKVAEDNNFESLHGNPAFEQLLAAQSNAQPR